MRLVIEDTRSLDAASTCSSGVSSSKGPPITEATTISSTSISSPKASILSRENPNLLERKFPSSSRTTAIIPVAADQSTKSSSNKLISKYSFIVILIPPEKF